MFRIQKYKVEEVMDHNVLLLFVSSYLIYIFYITEVYVVKTR